MSELNQEKKCPYCKDYLCGTYGVACVRMECGGEKCVCHSKEEKSVCGCGEPETKGVVHRDGKPCIVDPNIPVYPPFVSKDEKKECEYCGQNLNDYNDKCPTHGMPQVENKDDSGEKKDCGHNAIESNMCEPYCRVCENNKICACTGCTGECSHCNDCHIPPHTDHIVEANDMVVDKPEEFEKYTKEFHEYWGNVYDYDEQHTKWWVNKILEARQEERKRIEKMARKIYARLYTEENKAGYDAIQEIINNLTQDE